MNINGGQPLVSVVVVTYNSSKTVIETLDSIFQQTYKNIELIISDDGSKDGTVEIVDKWLIQHKYKFVRTSFLTVNENTGTSCNCNRGYAEAKGSWIKGIAGDDVLKLECIEQMVGYAISYPDVDIFFSKVQGFDKNGLIDSSELPFRYSPFRLGKDDFLFALTLGNFIPAASCFIKLDCFKELGGFDEDIKLMEDWPFWIKAAYNQKKFKLIDKALVMYRVGEQSVSLNPDKSDAYIESEIKSREYALAIQRKIDFWLWLWGKCTLLSNYSKRQPNFYSYIRLANPKIFKIIRMLKNNR